MEIVTAAHSDTGKVRTRNEDSFICMSGQTNLVNVDAVLVVADGMGGHAAGDVASRMAVDHITEQITNAGTVIDKRTTTRYLSLLNKLLKKPIWRSMNPATSITSLEWGPPALWELYLGLGCSSLMLEIVEPISLRTESRAN